MGSEFFVKKVFNLSINIIFLSIFLIVNLVVLFNAVKINTSIPFLLDNKILLLLGIAFMLFILFIMKKIKVKFLERNILILLSILLFIVEIFIVLTSLFRSGWDVSMIYDAAYSNVFSNYPKISFNASKYYFEMYPNNVFVLLYEMFFVFITRSIGKGQRTLSFILCFNNCIIYFVSCLLLYFCVKKITNNKKISLLSWIIYFILVGTSSWILIPYSDSLGLLFPILVLFIYLYFSKNNYLKCFLISLVSFIGYQIKPQVILCFIVVVIIEIINFLVTEKINKKNIVKVAKKSLLVIIAFMLVLVPLTYFKNDVMKLNPNKKIGATHFLMMGLNTDTNGVWSGDDVNFSSSQPNQKIRKEKNLEEFRERLTSMSTNTLVTHLRNKILVNFNDGTFAFGIEGNFYIWGYEDIFSFSSLIREFTFSSGKYYIYPASIRQAIWLVVLLLILFSFSKKYNKDILIIQLSLIGLFMFEMLFEARSRYLFTYVPYFIILSVYGIDKLYRKIKKRCI